MKDIFKDGESTEFSGKVIVALAQDPNIMKYTSKVLIGAEYAQSHDIKDIDGRSINSFRQLKFIASNYVLPTQLSFLNSFIPGFLKIPQFLLDIVNSKY
jgi:dehydrogenase/reductase SDR family protein 1